MLIHLTLTLALAGLLGACTHAPDTQPLPVSLDASSTMIPAKDSPQLLHAIAFGSCSKSNLPQPLFRKVAEEKPDLWIWTGDVIYGDSRDASVLARRYEEQLQHADYRRFLVSQVPVIGTYDDHDYGEKNSGRYYPTRAASMQLFLDFVNEPKDSPRRQQSGLYTSYRLGPDGRRVKILVTDNRYNADEPGKQGDILGPEQWEWLEQEMLQVDAELVLIVSGTQILPFEHKYEKWADWPQARQRLIDLVDRSPYPNIILISGDRHLAELSKMDLPSGKTVWEVTSSGMTHSYREANDSSSPNSLRVGPMLPRLNYGVLKIDWESPAPAVSIEVHDINKEAIIKQTVPLRKRK
ncbi:MAG TPA: alkaline phosphatase D family protein [Oligoflexus sp.]|uniref:alkaline phosphatase D family protein n=1 Tax=Oligoflexus sp. TaxID=1971216 RepID=UPI002D33F464|nr:alkaline phosphatase D family protein [Oligoflexus sp.]HYX38778.1 alkaline phosphatase D family protein [Oligoflexus sp.]